jgi:hypothetical protein
VIALVPPPLFTTRVVDEALLTAGFDREADFPFEDGVRAIHYRRGEGRALLVIGAREGAAVLQLEDVEPALVDALARALEADRLPDLIAAVRDATDPRAAVRAIGRLSVLFYLPDRAALADALAVVRARLTDPDSLVRWAAHLALPPEEKPPA